MRTCSVDDCDWPHNARGYCFGHYERWKKYGHPDADRPLNTHVKPNASMAERLARRIAPGLSDDECWKWLGGAAGKKPGYTGYGKLTVAGKSHDAHRASWELHNKRKIPAGYQVMHTCDTPLCINPRHLKIGTNEDNMNDMKSKGRDAFRGPATGRLRSRRRPTR